MTHSLNDLGEDDLGYRHLLYSTAVILPCPLFAQAAAPQEAVQEKSGAKQIYTAADFARFAPTTALDMVRQIPGFTIDALEDRRGLGQATQNILIDGRRISGKANDASTALGRINASDVVRIEVVDGATLNISGLSGQVANIFTKVKGMSGNFAWNPQFRTRVTDPVLYDGSLSVTGRTGALDYTLSLANESRRQGNEGLETAFDNMGRINDYRQEVLTVNQDGPKIAGNFSYADKSGGIANLNLSYQKFYSTVHEDSRRSFPGQVDRRRDYLEREREWNYEIGGDYEFDMGGGRLKLIGLRRFEHSPYRNVVRVAYGDNRADTGDRFRRIADEGESILRSEYRWKSGVADWQISAEGAYNTLDNSSNLATLNPAGDFVNIPLPGGDTVVKEKRGEIALGYGRPLGKTMTLQTSLGAEYSTLTQNGAGGLNRQFFRPKGFVSLSWKASSKLDINTKVERAVGQLNFYDFAASVNLSGGVGNAGNPDLRPPQSWEVEAEANRSLGPWGSIKLKLYAKFISDAVVQVPIGLSGEGPGNIDKARLLGLNWNSSFNFDPLGWKGAKLDIDIRLKKSRLRDPVSQAVRQFNEDNKHEINIDFRHDIPGSPWAWGMNYFHFKQTPNVRLDQIWQFTMYDGDLGAFVENKNIFGLTVRAGIANILGTDEHFGRVAYVGRITGPIAFAEDRERHFGPVFSFSIKGKF